MKNSEILRAAKAKVVDPNHWTQGVYGKNEIGDSVTTPDEAVCFCMIGALRAVAGSRNFNQSHPLEPFLDQVVEKYQLANGVDYDNVDDEVTVFNDHHTHEEVLAAYDFAIALAEKQEAELETAS